MIAVYKREVKGYFITPLGYVFTGVFLMACAFVFYVNNLLTRSGDLSGLFSMMGYLWMLLCPLLVMRLIAGERRQATEKLLQSAPLATSSIVLGKYAAACTVLFVTAALSMLYPLATKWLGGAHLPEILTGYAGFLLMGCSFIAFDLMISSLFDSPNSAMVFCLGANLMLWLVSLVAPSASPLTRPFVQFFSLYDRVAPFLHGQLSPASIVFFVVFSTMCLLGCVFLVQARNWGKLR